MQEAPTALTVRIFPGAQNLALFAAVSHGFFARRGLAVELQFTRNSIELRDGLAAGEYDIAHCAVDNAVAMREAGHDVLILCGGDNSMNELFVQPGITGVEQLRGRTLIVDAPDTAYALQARKILKNHGLHAGDYAVRQVGGTFQRVRAMQDDPAHAASMLNPPFSLQATASGLRSLGRVADLLGPYQASGAFAMRGWLARNGAVLERYFAAWIEALRWSLAPAHRTAATALLAERLALAPALAEATYAALAEPRYGLVPDAAFDAPGFANMMAIRVEMEGAGQAPGARAEDCVDLRWYEAGLRLAA